MAVCADLRPPPPALRPPPRYAGGGNVTTLALLHLAPRPGEIERNKRVIERAVLRGSAMGARLIVTPELVVSGYGFRDVIGTDWIARDQAALFDWAG